MLHPTIRFRWYYKINSYNINTLAFIGGSISPSENVSVTHGSSKKFTITPNYNWELFSVEVNGVNKGKIYTYTFTNVTRACQIIARFRKKSGGGGNPPLPPML